MNEELIQKIMDSLYDDSREETIWAMIGQFYSHQMRSTAIFVWIVGLFFLAISVVCAVLFFYAETIQWQIAFAALFIVTMGWLSIMKVFAWLMIHRNSIKREIKRLELRIAESNVAEKLH